MWYWASVAKFQPVFPNNFHLKDLYHSFFHEETTSTHDQNLNKVNSVWYRTTNYNSDVHTSKRIRENAFKVTQISQWIIFAFSCPLFVFERRAGLPSPPSPKSFLLHFCNAPIHMPVLGIGSDTMCLYPYSQFSPDTINRYQVSDETMLSWLGKIHITTVVRLNDVEITTKPPNHQSEVQHRVYVTFG